jgi:hypothetical protein
VFDLANGTSHTVSIRERFEIQIVQPEWGRFPFLAVSDTLDHKMDRFEGRWDPCRRTARPSIPSVGPGTSFCGAGRTPTPTSLSKPGGIRSPASRRLTPANLSPICERGEWALKTRHIAACGGVGGPSAHHALRCWTMAALRTRPSLAVLATFATVVVLLLALVWLFQRRLTCTNPPQARLVLRTVHGE